MPAATVNRRLCELLSPGRASDFHGVVYLMLQEAFVFWQDESLMPSYNPCRPIPWTFCAISLRQVRVPSIAVHDQVPSLPDRRHTFADEQRNTTDVPVQLRVQLQRQHQRTYAFPQPRSLALHSEPIFLYVFSGRRRQGDYQHHVMQKLAQRNRLGFLAIP